MPSHQTSPETIFALKAAYYAYRSSLELFSTSLVTPHLSQTCHQICRPLPSYNASNRETIIGFLEDSWRVKSAAEWAQTRGCIVVSALTEEQRADGLEAVERELGAEVRRRAEGEEGWEGLRVGLWDEGSGDGEEGKVIVNYWWRKDLVGGEEKWVQCLHDIVFLGSKVARS